MNYRIYILLIVFTMTFQSLRSESVASGTCGKDINGNIIWELTNDSLLIITGGGPMQEYDYRNNPAPWRKYNMNITGVVVSEGVTSIGDYAFADLKMLRTIKLPETIVSVGKCGLALCVRIKNITIPNSVKYIGDGAFSECVNLQNIVIPNSVEIVGNGTFAYCKNLKVIKIGCAVKSLGNDCFAFCEQLANVDIPNSVHHVGKRLYDSCTNLQSVEFGDSVTCIGDSTFIYCPNLKRVKLGDSVKHIGKDSFCGCSKLESFTWPKHLTYIGDGAFMGCSALESVYIPKSLKSSLHHALPNTKITVEEGNTRYRSIDNVLYTYNIDTLIFCARQKRGKVEIPGTVRYICDNAFYNCRKITDIILPNSLKTIEAFAFYGCEKLHRISIPNSVQRIEVEAFSNCYNLKKVEIGRSVSNMISFASIGPFSSCRKLMNIIVNPDNVNYVVQDGILYDGALETIIYSTKKIEEVYIPETVKFINCSAFDYCRKIRRVNIPESVECIYEYAFSGCHNLRRIVLPSNIIVGQYAFRNCNKLKDIVLNSKDLNRVSSILYSGIKFGQCKFFVPAGTSELYKQFSFNWRSEKQGYREIMWKDFGEIVECP